MSSQVPEVVPERPGKTRTIRRCRRLRHQTLSDAGCVHFRSGTSVPFTSSSRDVRNLLRSGFRAPFRSGRYCGADRHPTLTASSPIGDHLRPRPLDLAVGAEVGFGAILVAWLLSSKGVPIGPAIVLSLIAGGLVGLGSGLLVVYARIDSFIATLGVSSVLLAVIAWISGGEDILNLGSHFQNIATGEFLGLTYPVYIMIVIGLIAWYVLDRTPAGRRIYATGGNLDAARLAGVRTSAVIILSRRLRCTRGRRRRPGKLATLHR